MSDGLTPEEAAYCYQFQPAGFLRTWNALYDTKCYRIWALGRWTWASLEKNNRRPQWSVEHFERGVIGWSIAIPIGIGTLTAWGYRRGRV
jgi:hypothetical protein